MLFFTDPLFDKAIEQATSATLKVALLLIPLFMLIELGIASVRYFFSDGERFVDFRKFFGQLLIWFFATQFITVMGFIDGFVNTIEYSIRSNVGDVNLPATFMDAQDLEIQSPLSDTLGTMDRIVNTIKSNANSIASVAISVVNLPQVIMAEILQATLYLVRLIVELISYILTSFLFIVGPLAIAFGMMPFVGDGITKNWFGTWFSIKCWAITMTVLDFLLAKFVDVMTSTTASQVLQAMQDSFTGGLLVRKVVLLAFPIMYIMTPFLTNLYVKGTGGQFMSMAVGGAVMLTKAVATGGKYIAVKAAGAAASTGASAAKSNP